MTKLLFLALSSSFLWAGKNPEQLTIFIFADQEHAAQATTNAQQAAAAGHPVVLVPNVTRSWINWQLQQAYERRQDPQTLYIEEEENKQKLP